jgi:hypothetical protein
MVMTIPATTPRQRGNAAPDAFHKEVEDFSAHCAYIRSVYALATRIWRDSSEDQRKLMQSIAPSFFLDGPANEPISCPHVVVWRSFQKGHKSRRRHLGTASNAVELMNGRAGELCLPCTPA